MCQETCGCTSVCMCMLGQRVVQGSCVSQDILELLLLVDVCVVSRAIEEGVQHCKHEEKRILRTELRRPGTRCCVELCGFRWEQGLVLNLTQSFFICITRRKADF